MTTNPTLLAVSDAAGVKINVLVTDTRANAANSGTPRLFELVVPAQAFVSSGSAVTCTLHVDVTTAGSVDFSYILSGESSMPSIGAVTPLAAAPVSPPKSRDLWAAPIGGKVIIPLRLLVGTAAVKVALPDAAAKSPTWLDLLSLTVTTDSKATIAGLALAPSTSAPVVGAPSTGTLDAALKALFPSPSGSEQITWGQSISANVPAGRELVLRNADVTGREWIIRGLRGTPDKWITIRAETPLGFKVRGLETWRGIGLYDCQYVRVDGLDGYGSGNRNADGSGDFVSFVEAVGGHHIAATRNRATNTGGHCVSFTAAEGMNAPANAYILYNVAVETSKRNPFNGSAFNLFHGTTKRTPDGPLASLGFTDYVIGNVAFGCESNVADPHWGITDGNCFILDVGDESGYDGTCLVAFNVGADNGGRGVHSLQTSGLVALFNTMVGNQRTVSEPASGEFSPHAGSRHQVRGNIAAATTRSPAVWYQQWEGGTPHLVNENVVLAGTADAPYNVPVDPAGLGYLRGASTKSRVVDDYRPKSGTPIGAADLLSRFRAIAAVFPDATGQWRKQAICGALDA